METIVRPGFAFHGNNAVMVRNILTLSCGKMLIQSRFLLTHARESGPATNFTIGGVNKLVWKSKLEVSLYDSWRQANRNERRIGDRDAKAT